MYVGKKYSKFNIKKVFKESITTKADFCIFEFKLPSKLSRNNLHNYTQHNKNTDLGILVQKDSINKRENTIIYSKNKALASVEKKNIILKLDNVNKMDYNKWLNVCDKQLPQINLYSIMIPTDHNLNYLLFEDCNLYIQELNAVIPSLSEYGNIVLFQNNEPLSSLSYILQCINYPRQVSLCLNLDWMLENNTSLEKVFEDIHKYKLENRISMVNTSQFPEEKTKLHVFIHKLNKNMIVYTDKI